LLYFKINIFEYYIFFYEIQNNKQSQYNGVSWFKAQNKWRAQIKFKGKTYSGGYFENEEEAAMKVNLLCDEHEQDRKNPSIDIPMPEKVINS
jgi:hypothetical protein